MRRALPFALAALAFPGCGGDGGDGGERRAAPRPTAPLSETVARWERAVALGSCRAYAPLALTFTRPAPAVPGGPPVADECRFYDRQLPRWRGIDLGPTARFGTAAIAEGPGPRQGPYTNHTAIFVLDWDGRYRFWGTQASQPQVGTRPPGDVDFQASADAFVKAVRDRDCRAFLRVTMPGSDFFRGVRSGEEACREVFRGRNLAPQLSADPGARPRRLGATRDLGFFGLATRRNHYTLVLGTRPAGVPAAQLRGRPPALVLNYFPNHRPAG